eukprot:s1427_g19.t2
MFHAIPSSDLHISLYLSSLSGHPSSSSFLVLLPRKFDLELQKEWGKAAKQRAVENKEARALCRKRSMKAADPVPKVDLAIDDLTIDGAVTWLNQELAIEGMLGGGTYGKVLKAQTVDGMDVAIKLVRKPTDELEDLRDVLAEAKIQLRFASCPYVVRAMGIASVAGGVMQGGALVMELCEASLWATLRSASAPHSRHQKLLWSYHIANGIFAIHSLKVIHLDVKIDNFLVNKEGRALLSDFGLSQASVRGVVQDARSNLGKATLTTAADMWAVGCCLFSIHAEEPQHLIHNIPSYQKLVTSMASVPEMLEEKLAPAIQFRLQRCLPESIAEVTQRCLAIAPAKRENAGELRKSLADLLGDK